MLEATIGTACSSCGREIRELEAHHRLTTEGGVFEYHAECGRAALDTYHRRGGLLRFVYPRSKEVVR